MNASGDRGGRAAEGIHAALGLQAPVFLPPAGELDLLQLGLEADGLPHSSRSFHEVRLLGDTAEDEQLFPDLEAVGESGLDQELLGALRVVAVELFPLGIPRRVVAVECGVKGGDPLFRTLAIEYGLVDLVPVQGLIHGHSDLFTNLAPYGPGHGVVGGFQRAVEVVATEDHEGRQGLHRSVYEFQATVQGLLVQGSGN